MVHRLFALALAAVIVGGSVAPAFAKGHFPIRTKCKGISKGLECKFQHR